MQPVGSEVSDAKWLHPWGQQVALTSHGAPAILGPLEPARFKPPSAETLWMTRATICGGGQWGCSLPTECQGCEISFERTAFNIAHLVAQLVAKS